MWTSLCNFLCNKFFNKPEVGFPQSDSSGCGIYGKRLKLIDRIWNPNGLLRLPKSSCQFPMQRENIDISDDEDCCIIAEIPRRKKPGNSTTTAVQKDPTISGKSSELSIPWSSFSFRKEPFEKICEDKDIKEMTFSKISGRDEATKEQPKKFFSTQRASISQGKLARSRLSYKNQLRKRMNFLQESYRLTEKIQYMQLLQSHTTYNLMTLRRPLKCTKGSNSQIEIIDLADEETKETDESTSKQEEQDVQIVEEIPVRSFQDMIKLKPVNSSISYKGMSSEHLKNSVDVLRLTNSTSALVEADCIDVTEKTDALEEKLRNFMQISGPSVREVENREPNYTPELKPEQETRIRNALSPDTKGEVLSRGFGLQITRQDMQTLAGLNWLNDEVINFYMNLIVERSKLDRMLPAAYAFNTFFYPKLVSDGYTSLRRWTKQVDIFSFDIILVPIHLGMHWCLSVIDFRYKCIKYYDSVGSPNNTCLERLLHYLKAESIDKKKKPFPTIDWKKSNVEDIPQQMNGSDCGVFCCMFAEHIARDCSILFTQDDMPYFRKKMFNWTSASTDKPPLCHIVKPGFWRKSEEYKLLPTLLESPNNFSENESIVLD